MKCNNGQSFLVVQEHNYCKFTIYRHYLKPTIERQIWIGFYKNDDNNKCFIKKLPKDVIIYIFSFVGKKKLLMPPCIAIDV